MITFQCLHSTSSILHCIWGSSWHDEWIVSGLNIPSCHGKTSCLLQSYKIEQHFMAMDIYWCPTSFTGASWEMQRIHWWYYNLPHLINCLNLCSHHLFLLTHPCIQDRMLNNILTLWELAGDGTLVMFGVHSKIQQKYFVGLLFAGNRNLLEIKIVPVWWPFSPSGFHEKMIIHWKTF